MRLRRYMGLGSSVKQTPAVIVANPEATLSTPSGRAENVASNEERQTVEHEDVIVPTFA